MRRLIFFFLFVFVGCDAENKSTLHSDGLALAIKQAQSKFALRDQSRWYLTQTRQITSQGLDTAPKPFHSDAMQLAEIHLRTYDYEASHYLKQPDQRDERRRLYQEGIDAVEKYLSPDILKFDYAAYYYFKGLFLIKLSDDSTFFEQLKHLQILQPLLNEADSDSVPGVDDYEGGGVYRLKAMMKSRDYYRGVPGGTYNPDEALKLINLALKSDRYPGNYPGDLYCDNFNVKAEIERLRTNDHKGAALFHAQTAYIFDSYLIDEIIPDFLLAETKDCVESSNQAVSQSGFVIKNAIESDDHHEFIYETGATFVPTGASSSALALQAYCVSDDYFSGPNGVVAQQVFQYNPGLHKNRTQMVVLKVSSDSTPCYQFFIIFDSARTPLAYLDVTPPALKDYRLTNEKFIEQTSKDLDRKAVELLNFSTSMAGQVGAKQNAYCLIKSAVVKKIDDGVLKTMKTEYFNVFGTRWETGTFTCPAEKTLALEIATCKADPALSTPFCNSYRLYLVPLQWVLKNLAETKNRLARLEGAESQVASDLAALRDQLQLETDQSKDVLGETDD
ncbi:MAG TPA: hypothetical protein VE954_34425 [Oligoflexus sp.]|uniref:hypothetical protein n=1 Tax=Oligoflexus sp. TaxID=1971216 RepID=UPI002D6E2B93|nr:hypothetical protein [Oligoflexus sp.]HYX38226.1 hypothetical protein [Oligoflexus sp.]